MILEANSNFSHEHWDMVIYDTLARLVDEGNSDTGNRNALLQLDAQHERSWLSRGSR